jgi:hypothetical protein
MNVIIANKNSALLQGLSIEIIKSSQGEFAVDDLITNFKNFFFQRMIIDITAIKNYKDIRTLQKLSIALDMDKIILLLDDNPESTSTDYLSKLISMGIYNFTTNIEGIMYLYNNPNTYRDVAQYHQLDNTIIDGMGFIKQAGPRIIGFKNINREAGSTSLIYMMKRQLEKNYRVVALEVDKKDFQFFQEKNMISTNVGELGSLISKYSNNDVILIDVNNSDVSISLCKEVYYLLQPSTIKLNRLMMGDAKVLQKYQGQKIILNQSLLSSKDVLDFEYESKMKIFYNMPPLDDRDKDSHVLNAFLSKVGFTKQVSGEVQKKSKLLGLFNI